MTSSRLLGHLLESGSTVSFATVADLLRLASRLPSRRSIADWCEALADDLDRLEEDEAIQDAPARLNLQYNLNLRRPAASLLQTLVRAPERLHSHEDLCGMIGTTLGALKVYVCEVRHSFEALGLDNPLKTVWGEGYALTDEGARFVRKASRSGLPMAGGTVGNDSIAAAFSKVPAI